MAKKLILLMLLIPLIVMISLFTATKTISIMVDVPVSGITVSGANTHIYLNLDKNETHTLNYTITPSNAKDHTVTVTAAKYNNNTLAEFDFEQSEGSVKIIPKTMGSAIIHVTTKDGGYRGSVIVHVESQKAFELKSISSSVEKTELNIGDKVQINTEFNPTNASNSILHYSSDNESVAIVNDKGVISALRPGTASILIRSDFDSNIYNTLTVTVLNNTVNNENNTYSPPGDFSELATEGDLPLHVPDGIETIDLKNVTARAYYVNSDGLEVSLDDVIELTLVKKEVAGVEYYSISYKFKDESFVGEYSIEASYDDGENDFKLSYENLSKTKEELIEVELEFDGGNETALFVGANVALPFTVSPESAEYNYTFSATSSDVVSSIKILGSKLYFESKALGTATVTLTASLKSDPTKFAKATVTVYVIPSSLVVANELVDGALSTLGEIFTLGKYEYVHKFDKATLESLSAVSNNTTVTTENELSLDLLFNGKGTLGTWFEEGIRWEVDSTYSDYVYVNKTADGKHEICFRDNSDTFDEIVEFRAIYEKGSKSISASCKIRCVANGINVYSYIDLYRATKLDVDNGYPRSVVLRSDIIDDFGFYYDEGKLKPHYTEIHTTYDDDYYKNIGKEADAKVKVLVEFRENVYGNGYTINAHNLTLGLLDEAGVPTGDTPAKDKNSPTLFKGPLDFIAMSGAIDGDGEEYKTYSKKAVVSVKGQDNICFALYEGVTLSNVNLKGATPNETEGLDLTDLDYAGTVVEILGDQTSIEYSRIQYGRMVIRAFGDINNPDKEINVNIKNTRLSEAREFIMRIGSNRFVQGNFDDPTPMLPGADDKTHDTKAEYNTFSDAKRNSYDEQFINTFVTLENSVLKNTGLLAIGVESHFSSYALADGRNFVETLSSLGTSFKKENGTTFLDSWKNLSKTSYGAKIKFVGEVNLYTWKPIDDVNSDTLIEIPLKDEIDKLKDSIIYKIPDVQKFLTLVGGLKFDVKAMVNKYNEWLIASGKTQIVHTVDGTKYVHGGIVFFGGGKNYGVFDSTEATSVSKNLPAYQVGLDEVGSGYLKQAAGDEPFYFLMFDSATYNLAPNGDDSVLNKKSN